MVCVLEKLDYMGIMKDVKLEKVEDIRR